IGFKAMQAACEALPAAILVTVILALRADSLSADFVWGATGVIVLCVVGQWVAGYFANRSAWIATFELFARLRVRMLNRLRALPMGFHDHHASGQVVTLMTQDVSTVESFTHEPLQQMVGAAVAPIIVFVVLAFQDLPMALATMLSVVLSLPIFLWTNRVFQRLAMERQELQGNAASRMIEYLQGLAVVRAFGVAGHRLIQFREALESFRGASDRMNRELSPLSALFLSVVFLGIPLVLFVGSYWLLGGRLDAALFLIFAILSLRVYLPLVAAAQGFESMRITDASLDRIATLFDAPVTPDVPERHQLAHFDLRFEQVDFHYDDASSSRASSPVLSELSFTAPAGELTAIVGPSGAGKSTVLQLVAGLRSPSGGTIRIGGVDQAELSQRQRFDAVTPVFQDVYLFPGTIYDNIAFGQPDAPRAAVIDAATRAQAHEFIERLPKGYDTPIQEAGHNLSGGERQRLTIARAILKDAPIVLLDEVTSALDATNERRVQEALAELVANKTVLVVAHRLATIQNANQILVLDHGRLAQCGTHEELTDQPGVYRTLLDARQRAEAWQVRVD
ncbi:MAG: ABC transporter ATP-binding protein, partial [Pseudomonadota bacterium]